jgi:hypothetical protein
MTFKPVLEHRTVPLPEAAVELTQVSVGTLVVLIVVVIAVGGFAFAFIRTCIEG